MGRLRGVSIGAGYFSQFHYEAWNRIAEVQLTALCDLDTERRHAAMTRYGIRRDYADYREMLEKEQPDFVDVITPPASHLEICRTAAQLGINVICQKPLAPRFAEARTIVEVARGVGIRFMVHENFRFQPWHREIKRLLDRGAVGDKLHTLTFRSRPGDGWPEDAYLDRQPYFREMPRFLIHETGVHFIDTFRYLAGDVRRCYCVLRKLNRFIRGEDCGLLVFEFTSGAIGVWDANRFNESSCDDPRYTFGEFLVEGNGGTIRLAMDGALTVQALGEPKRPHPYHHENRGFGGDCCHATLRHFVDRLLDGQPFETDGDEYLKTLAVEEAFYQSAERKVPVEVEY